LVVRQRRNAVNANYAVWSYEQLVGIREQLEELLRIGEDYPDVRAQLKAVTEELAKRAFMLVGTLSMETRCQFIFPLAAAPPAGL